MEPKNTGSHIEKGFLFYFVLFLNNIIILNLTLKEHIFCYISVGCYFFALKLHDFFPSSLALNLRPFFKKSDLGL